LDTAEATGNAIQFREVRVVAKSNRPPNKPQSLRDFHRQFKDGAERASAFMRQLEEDGARLNEHPLVHERQENLRQLAEALRGTTTSQPSESRQEPRPKPVGGHPFTLTDDEKARLQAFYLANPPLRGKRKQSDVFKEMRLLLPKGKRDISDRTLYRVIVRPTRL